jgi:hypothetical protein
MPFLAVHTSYPTGNIYLKSPGQHEKLLNETYLVSTFLRKNYLIFVDERHLFLAMQCLRCSAGRISAGKQVNDV